MFHVEHTSPNETQAPPACSTGVQIPTNGAWSIDWLEFTVDSLDDAWAIIGLDQPLRDYFGPCKAGLHGYKFSRSGNGITIMWGSSRNDAHVVMSGAGCRFWESHDDWISWSEMLKWATREMGARISRLDVALDAIDVPFGPNEVAACIQNRRVTTRWSLKSAWRHTMLDPENMDPHGTVYIGSPKSDARMRVYDKRREQGNKLPADCPTWYRFEIQLRNESARAMADKLVSKGWHGVRKAFRGYVNFETPTGATNPNWYFLMENAIQEPLGVFRGKTNAETTQHWLQTQVASAMARVVDEVGDASKIMGDQEEAVVLKLKKRRAGKPNVSRETLDLTNS